MKFRVWGVLLLLTAPIVALAQGGTPLPVPVIAIIDVDQVQVEALAAKRPINSSIFPAPIRFGAGSLLVNLS